MADNDSVENVSDALWMSVLAGLGGVFILGLLFGCFYLVDPVGKLLVEQHISYLLAAVVITFVAGFGLSLQLTLKMQFWRGKWK